MFPLLHKPQIGEEVEVYANSCWYRGKLIGISETEIYLKSPARTWTISLERVQKMQSKGTPKKPLQR